MPNIFTYTVVCILISFAVLMVISIAAVYVLGLLRDNSLQQERDIKKELNYFQELNVEGKLSDVEYRNIKEGFFDRLIEAGKSTKHERGKSKDAIDYYSIMLKSPASVVDRSGGIDDKTAEQETQKIGCIRDNDNKNIHDNKQTDTTGNNIINQRNPEDTVREFQ
ncbi:MAG: hypothetical protein LBQ66_06370 [Planctomycetaceae bacterium]|jgi:hypothetical protein|nr:hypothetical protein [Planctomycetaceae bacterium]